MTKEEVINQLLANDFVVCIVGKDLVFTQKFLNLMKEPVPTSTSLTTITYAPTVTVEQAWGDNKKELWNNFIKDTEIPHRVNTGSGNYTVRQFSKSAVNKLIQIMSKPGVNYQTLVDSTKHYYKTVTYKILLSRYLLEDVWLDEYNEYIKKKLPGSVEHTPGTSRFED